MSFVFSRVTRLVAGLSLVLCVAPTALGVEWFDDFGDGNLTDGVPVTWTYDEIGYTPGNYDASSGDLMLSNPDGADDSSLVPTVDVSFTDTYVRTQAMVLPGPVPEEQIGGTLGVVARWDPMSLTGYSAILSNGAHLQLLKVVGGGPENLAELDNLDIDTVTDAMIELNVVGQQLSVYLWRPEETKPTEPTLTFEDTLDPITTGGRAGLLFNENDDATIGVFRFAAAQDTPFVDVVTLDGDFNEDGKVDAADYTVWRDGLGTDFEVADYETWKQNFGAGGGAAAATGSSAVPEPASLMLVGFALGLVSLVRGRRW